MNPTPLTTTSSVSLHKPDAVTEAVVTAVAEAGDTSPLELQPLATTIDLDALGALIRENENLTVEFTYHGYHVCISGSGEITVRE